MKVVVNIFGAPCVGKTHLAKQLSQETGWGYVPEYATHIIRIGKTELLTNQPEITGGQLKWLREALEKHDIVITDSPCDLALIYMRNPAHLPDVIGIMEAAKEGVFTINILLWHTDESIREFTKEGRVHGLNESLAIQDKISVMLAGGLVVDGLTAEGIPYKYTHGSQSHIFVRRGCDVAELAERVRKEIGRQFDAR